MDRKICPLKRIELTLAIVRTGLALLMAVFVIHTWYFG